MHEGNGTEVVVAEPALPLTLARDPELEIAEATRAARALATVLDQRPEKVLRNGKRYLMFEDWQTVARFYGLVVRVLRVTYEEYPVGDGVVRGFTAWAEAVHASSGIVFAAAEASCLSDEEKWSRAPLFQVKSMAETRACAKAYRTALGHVPVLAGFSATPAEEIVDAFQTSGASGDPPTPTRERGPDTRPISEAQKRRMFSIAKNAGHEVDTVKRWLRATYHVQSSADITREKYDAICVRLEDKADLLAEVTALEAEAAAETGYA